MKMHSMIIAQFVVAAAAFGASDVAAQKSYTTLPSVIVVANGAADKLRAQAEALFDQPSKAGKAARLLEREAALRTDADPLAIEALDRSAQLYSTAGEHRRAENVMRRAAERALRRGDVVRSAHAYLDAAFVALDSKDVGRAYDYARQADLLALSPLMTSADRLSIVKRIDPARAQLGSLIH